jgi:protoporphyrinogen oxidase
LTTYLEGTGLVEPVVKHRKAFYSRTLRLGVMAVRNFSIPARVIIFPEARYMFNRVSEMNQFADLGYPAGESILMIDVICDRGDRVERMPEKEFNELLLKNFLSLGWVKESDVRLVFSLRFPGAYPVLTEERYEAQEAIEVFFADSGVYLCGREASSDYNNAHNAIGKGFLTARFLAGEIDAGEFRRRSATIGRLPIQD